MEQQSQQINPRRTVNFENIRLHSPVKENAIPKRRNDTNSVYSFGLKYSLKVEKKILKNIPNSEYFNLDFKRLKQKLLTDKNFREAYAQRILLNKNTKKSYASIEKPFPLLKKVSSSQAIDKTEDFLHSVIKSPFHKKLNGSIERNIRLRKNRGIEVCERETQNNFFFSKLQELSKNITFKNKEEEKNIFDFHLLNNFNKNNNSKKDKEALEESDDLEADFDPISNNRNLVNAPVMHSQNKNQFFLIGSNFGSKNILKKQAKNVILSIDQINLQREKKELEKIERDIINSIERARTRSKVEQDCKENFYNTTLNFNFDQKRESAAAMEKIFNESSISSIANNFKTKYNFNFNKHLRTNNLKNNSDRNLIEIKDDDLSKISGNRNLLFKNIKNNNCDCLDSRIIENENENLLSERIMENKNTEDDKASQLEFNESLNKENFQEYLNLKSSNLTKVNFNNKSYDASKKNSHVTTHENLADEKSAKYLKSGNLAVQFQNNFNNSIVSDMHKSKNYSTEQNFDFKNIDKNISNYNKNENYISKYKSNLNYNTISSLAFSKNPLETQISNILSDCIEINNNNSLKDVCKYNSDLNAIRNKPKQFKPDFSKYKFDKKRKQKDCLIDDFQHYWDKKEKSDKLKIKLERNLENNYNKLSLFFGNE